MIFRNHCLCFLVRTRKVLLFCLLLLYLRSSSEFDLNEHFLHSVDPTGLLIDSARKLVLPFIPEVSVDERREALLRVSSLALARGVTTIVDFGRYYPGESVKLSWEDFSGNFCIVTMENHAKTAFPISENL